MCQSGASMHGNTKRHVYYVRAHSKALSSKHTTSKTTPKRHAVTHTNTHVAHSHCPPVVVVFIESEPVTAQLG